MFKRILGVLSLLLGLAVTAWAALTAAFAVPSNYEIEGAGLEFVSELIVKYGLRSYFLLMSVGLSLCLTSVALFLAPRKRRVAATDGNAALAPQAKSAEAAPSSEKSEASRGEVSGEQPELIRVFRSRVMATAFCNPGGRSRQWIIREAKVGDVVTCRSVGSGGVDDPESVGVFSVKGEQIGIMDSSLFLSIREHYPHHRMGVTVDRISGGAGIPYTCHIRVCIYRS